MNPFENFKKIGTLRTSDDEYEPGITGITEKVENSEEKKEDEYSFSKILIIICLILSVVLVGQLSRLQITKGAQSQTLAEGNRIRTEELEASRGIIYDKNKKPLLKNIPRYQLIINSLDLPRDKTSRIDLYERIQNISQIDPETIKNIEEQKLYTKKDPIIIKDNLVRDEAMLTELKLQDLPAIKIQTVSIRQYQEIPALASIIGYLGKITDQELENHSEYNLSDSLGKTGLELTYEAELRGQKGLKQIEVNAQGIIERDLSTKEPVAGNNLITTIDSDLQKKAYEVLEAKIKELKVEHGVVIVENPQTGGILAMVSYPSYNNNLFAQGISSKDYQKINNDPAKPLLNLAISGTYPSGSTIKPIIAAAALNEGVISADTSLDTSAGEIKIGDWVFPDWKVHGVTAVRQAIAESNDIFFYALGGGWKNIIGLGIDKIVEYLQKFGFGRETGIDLVGEAKGLVPTPDWKKKTQNDSWYLGDTYHLAIGQGDLLVTPLQLLNATSAIANGGKLYKPHFADYETDQKGNVVKKYDPQIINVNPATQDSVEVVKEAMQQAVTNGSARLLQDLPVSSGGKTGTAQFSASLTDTHAWFTAFAPYATPEVAVVVLIEHGGGGDVSAAPVANDILKYYFSREK